MKLAAVLLPKWDAHKKDWILAGEVQMDGMVITLVLDRRRKRSRPDPREGELWAFHPGRLIWVNAEGSEAVWSVYPAHRIHPQSRGIGTRRLVRGMMHDSRGVARRKAWFQNRSYGVAV